MEKQEFDNLVSEVGKQTAEKIAAEMKNYNDKLAKLDGTATQEEMTELKTALETAIGEVKNIAEKQGKSITDLAQALEGGGVKGQTIEECLTKSKDKLEKVILDRSGRLTEEFVINADKEGNFFMRPYQRKVVGPHATVDEVGHASHTASVSEGSISAATIMRMAANADIINQYRDNPMVFGLVDLQSAPLYGGNRYVYWEEVPVEGSPTIVPEGGKKPEMQYRYVLRSEEYKKVAAHRVMTDEFLFDFSTIEGNIRSLFMQDLSKTLNDNVIGNIISAATPYSDGAAYTFGGTDPVLNPTDYDVFLAMSSQAEKATFSTAANAALVSIDKGYRIGGKRENDSGDGGWLNRPAILNGLNITRTAQMTGDNVLVGDFKNYVLAMRGGVIVRFGHINEQLIENKITMVIEQFYYDYIPALRKPSIVKGPTFADVKAAISGTT